jgi:hypothetical protein
MSASSLISLGGPPNGSDIVAQYWPNYSTLNADGNQLENAAHLINYFGPPQGGLEQVARDSRMTDRYQLPRAYRNKSVYLKELILGLIIDTQNWAIQRPDGLPMTQIDSMLVKWDVWKFEEGYAERVPEEGTSRVMSSGYEQRQAGMLRRGKAIQVEHGFWKTPEGQLHYKRQVLQIVTAVDNTLSMDVLCTYASVRQDHANWVLNNIYENSLDQEILRLQARKFAQWQKYSHGPEKTVSELKEILETRNNGRGPEMMIVPRGCEVLMRGATNSAKLDPQVVGGQLAEMRISQQPDSITTMNGLRVHYTRKFKNVMGGQIPHDPFTRDRMFGEYFQMRPHSLNLYRERGYKSSHRDIMIMDYDEDRFKKWTLKDVVNNMVDNGEFDDDGYLKGHQPHDNPPSAAIPLTATWSTTARGLRTGSKIVRSPFETMVKNGVQQAILFGEIPIDFLSQDVIIEMARQIANKNLNTVLYDTISYTRLLGGPLPANGFGRVTFNLLHTTATAVAAAPLGTTPQKNEKYGYSGLVSFGYVVPSLTRSSTSSTSGAPIVQDLDTIHNQNLSLLVDAATRASYAGLYTQLGDMATKQSLVLRTRDLLSQPQDIQMEKLLNPLNILSNPPANTTKRELASLQEKARDLLTTYTPPVQSDLSVSTETMASTPLDESVKRPAVFTQEDITKYTNEGHRFEYLDLDTGAKTSPYTLDSTNVRDLLKLSAAKPTYAAGLAEPNAQTDPNIPFEGKQLTADQLERINLDDIDWRIKDARKRAPPVLAVVLNLLLCPLKKQFFNFLVDNDILFPFTPVIVRPWVDMSTYSVLVGSGGEETGATYINNADCMLQDDATAKKHSAHFTFNSKAVIHNSSRVALEDDCAIKGYVGGGKAKKILTVDHVNEISQNNWLIPANDNRGSVFVLLTPYQEDHYLPPVWHLSGKLDHSDPNSAPDVYFEPTTVSNLINTAAKPDSHPLDWLDTRFNRIVHQGTQLCYNPSKVDMSAVILGTDSHMGINVYDGMMRDLQSGSLLMKDCNYDNRQNYTNFFTL